MKTAFARRRLALGFVLSVAVLLCTGARWPERAEAAVDAADLERFASADAIVVLEEWQIKLKGGERSGVRRRVVYVLTDEGRDAAMLILDSNAFGRYTNTRLWVRQPGGQTSKFDEDDGSLFGVSDLNSLYDTQILVLRPPGLVAGTTVAIETRFQREADRPQDLFNVQEDVPVARAIISVDARGGWEVLAHVASGANPGPTEAREEATWVFENLPAQTASEMPFAPAQPVTTIALDYVPPGGSSPFADWATTVRWMEDLFERAEGDSPDLRATLAEVRSSSGDVVESIGRLARKLRYYAIELGWGGYIPRPPELTLSRSLGDCKDKARLMVSLLRRAEVEAYPVLVIAPSDGFVPEGLPSPFQFNHMIVAVPWSGREAEPGMAVAEHPDLGVLRFYDATLSDASPQDIPLPLEGGAALVIHPRTSSLFRLPGSGADDNVVVQRLDLTISADGSVLASGEMRASGVMRSPLAGDDGESIRPDELRESVYSRLSGLLPTIQDLEVGPVVADSNGIWSYSFEASSDDLLADFGAIRLFEPGSLLPANALPLPGEDASSDTAFFPLQGTQREIFTVSLAGNAALNAPDAVEIANELGHVRLETRIEEGSIRIEREVGLTARAVRADQRELVLELREGLEQVNAVAVAFEIGEKE